MAKKRQGPLDDYRDKRDPSRTNEPFEVAPAAKMTGVGTLQGAFVVHLHDATRRHYDLRIEVGGVLLSFAVPKGPSLDPAAKRLAVQTEAHPLPYLDFEAVIPEGNYGAGAMIAWDRGRVRYLEQSAEAGLESGKIDFELAGYKLKGRFALVKTSGRRPDEKPGGPAQWLLLKKTDAFSRAGSDIVAEMPESILSGLTVDALPTADRIAADIEARAAVLGAPEQPVVARRITPMLCALEGAELADPGYLYELKLDGVRILADKHGAETTLSYRTSRPATASYPEIADAVSRLALDRVLLDGEIVAFDDEGRPDFQRLARRIHALRPADVRYVAVSVPVVYLVFDVLAIGSRDLRTLALRDRRALLSEIVPPRGPVRQLDCIEGRGDALFEFCREQGLEGVVGKRIEAPYREGPTRTADWVKFKCEQDADFVVVGWTLGTGGRARLGALDLAVFDGDDLIVRGKVGSGLSEKAIDSLLPQLEALEIPESAARGDYDAAPRGRRFVRPEIVVSVRYLGFSDGGRLRFPVFKGVRADVDPRACTVGARLEDDDGVFAAGTIEEPNLSSDAGSGERSGTGGGRADTRVTGERRVKLTNQNKVFWPLEGYTKGDLCDYYDAVAPTLLPYLRDRPVVLVRYPDGIEGKSFYQWRVPPAAPKWVRSFPVRALEEDGKDKATFIIEDVDTLLYIANLGCIPLHVLASRSQSLESCDFLTIDFDLPEEDRARGDVTKAITLARELHGLLTEIGLVGFPKTSGQTGLHVLVPLGPGIAFETAKVLNELLGRIIAARHADIATMERVKDKRGGRALIDTGQTGRSRTIVAPYSVRAYPGARVSTPLDWDEVGFSLDARRHTIFTVIDRVGRVGDPMRPLLDARPDVHAAVDALAKLLPG